MSNKTEMKRAALYLRKSTDTEDKQVKSIDDQRTDGTNLCQQHNYKIVQTYEDNLSGWKDRPSYERMFQDAENGLFDVIVCLDRSRFTREYVADAIADKDKLADCGIMLHYVNGGLIDPKNDEMGPWLCERVYEIMNNQYVKNLSLSVIQAKRNRAIAGVVTGGATPLGYKHWPKDSVTKKNDKPGYDVASQDEIDLLQNIFQWFANGESETRIAKRLLAMGVVNKVSGKPFTDVGIKRILQNEVYLGHTILHRQSQGKFHYVGENGIERIPDKKRNKQKEKIISKPVRVENTHIPLIAVDLWNKVHGRFQQRSATNTKPRGKHGFLLTGLLKCGNCGSSMVGHALRGKLGYRCGNCNCNGRGHVTEAILLPYIFKTICSDLLESLPLPDETPARIDEKKQLTKEIERITKDIDRAENNFLRATNDRLLDSLQTKINGMRETLDQLQIRLQKMEQIESNHALIENALRNTLPEFIWQDEKQEYLRLTADELTAVIESVRSMGCVMTCKFRSEKRAKNIRHVLTSIVLRFGSITKRHFANRIKSSHVMCKNEVTPSSVRTCTTHCAGYWEFLQTVAIEHVIAH